MNVEARRSLFSAIAAALRAAFPDRAVSLLVDLERRLEPGPWNLDALDAKERATAGREALTRPPLSRDQLLAEAERALRAADPDGADRGLRDLEQWTRRSVLVAFLAISGRFHLGRVEQSEYVEWAGDALEAGYDSPALRILAGLHGEEEMNDWAFLPRLNTVVLELGLHVRDDDAVVQYAREVSRDVVLGVLDPEEAVRRLGEPYGWSGRTTVPTVIRPWLDLYAQAYEDYGQPRIVGEVEEVMALARATLNDVR